MPARYCNWSDAAEFVDGDSMSADPAKGQELALVVEKLFENRVRGALDLPIIEATSPETFAQAKTICAMKTAAEYIRYRIQAQGTAENTWYADHLDAQADTLIEQLLADLAPDDAVVAPNPMASIPYSGDQTTRPAALFKRDNIATGSGHW